ncbi:MAG: hypothetical protein ACO3PR_16450, partial [Limisphaerales bacterium]
TTDIEAVHAAGFQGFHLFHGKGGAWPGVSHLLGKQGRTILGEAEKRGHVMGFVVFPSFGACDF